ncbi:MAG TPA: 3'-5' exonuclease, partial [Petrotogaceae bacterium]|nr:3'-5' exonuclease [Petrotogaceae bacterium]
MVDFENTVYVAIDFETTGLRPDLGDRIIEIAAFPIYKGQIRTDYSFYSLVNPEVTIPKEVSHYHKLNNIHIA